MRRGGRHAAPGARGELRHGRRARGGGPGGGDGGPTPTLTVRGDPADAVQSDGAGAYVDGEARVDISIAADDFHFKPSDHHKKGTRYLVLELGTVVDGIDPFGGDPQVLDYFTDFRIHEGLMIDCGQSLSRFGRFLFDSEQGQAHLAFGVPGLGGTPFTVARTDNGDGTSSWTILSEGTGYLRLDSVYQGTFEVPFQFELTGEGC